LVLENCSFQYCLLTDVNIAHSDVSIGALHFIKTAWLSVAYSTVSVCERWRWTFWTPFVTVIALQIGHWI